MAGHSKFKNIMRRKGAQDQERAKKFTRIARELMVAVAGGVTDPSMNSRLRNAIDAAKEINMPKDKIENAIKKGSDKTLHENYEDMVYEGYGPEGVAIMVDTLTNNKNRTASEIRAAFTKYGGNLGETGSVNYLFNRVGCVIFPSDVVTDFEKFLELALEAGADDCVEEEEEYEVFCDVKNLGTVKNFIENALKKTAMSAKIIRKPITTVEIADQEIMNKLVKLVDALEDCEDVQSVTTNIA